MRRQAIGTDDGVSATFLLGFEKFDIATPGDVLERMDECDVLRAEQAQQHEELQERTPQGGQAVHQG